MRGRIEDRMPDAVSVGVRRLRGSLAGLAGAATSRWRRLVPEFVRRRYALKFGIVLFVIGLSVAAMGAGATVQIRDEVQSGVHDSYANLAEGEARTVEAWNDRNRDAARMVARSAVVQNGSPEHVQSRIGGVTADLPPGTANVHYVDTAEGTILASTEFSANGESLSAVDAPWVDAARDGVSGVHISRAYESGFVGTIAGQSGPGAEAVVAYTTEVPGQSDRVVVYTAHLNAMSEEIGSGEEGGLTLVLDGEGRIVGDEVNQQLLVPYVDDASPVVSEARTRRPDNPGATYVERPRGALATTASPLPDSPYVVGFAPVSGTDWVVLVHAPAKQAYGFVTTVVRWGFTATLAGVLLITVLGTVLGRNTAVAIDRLTAKTERMEAGDLEVDLETDRVDNIGRLYEGFASMRDALHEQIDEAEAARQDAETARREAEAMTEHLETKADAYSGVMASVADGDMTRRMDPGSENEAMTDIATAFNDMIADLERTIGEVTTFAERVAAASQEVTASSEEVKSASEQVSSSVQEIADGADRQDDQLQSIAEEMDGLSTTVEEIAASADQVADLSRGTTETGEDARERAEEAIDEMEAVEEEAESTVGAMARLQDRIERVEEVTEFIQDVAEQTNVLALNANIEAARAGQAGEGFAVVADEVKSLAEETREAAEDIEGLVEEIHDQTERTAEEVRGTSEEVGRSADVVRETVDALEEIVENAEETNVGVQQISDATTEQATSTNQVVGMVEEVSSIARQTSGEAEHVAGAAEEQTSALSEMTDGASTLAGQATRLSEALDRFETADEAGTAEEGDGIVQQLPRRND